MEQIIVIGYGRFGQSVANTLQKLGKKVMVIDKDTKLIDKVSDQISYSLALDTTNLTNIKSSGINHFDAAVVAFSTDVQASIITTINLKNLGVKYIVAKANNENHAKILRKLGADKVVFPEKEMGERLAQNLHDDSFFEISSLSPGYGITQIKVPGEWDYKTLSELELSSRYKLNIVTIKNSNNITIFPKADDTIRRDDTLIVAGATTHLKALQTAQSKRGKIL